MNKYNSFLDIALQEKKGPICAMLGPLKEKTRILSYRGQ